MKRHRSAGRRYVCGNKLGHEIIDLGVDGRIILEWRLGK
jgi:hypothetical protein